MDSEVLLVASEGAPDIREAYFEAVAPADPGDSRVLAVNYASDPDSWVADWRRYVGPTPAECVLVSVGETHRSSASGVEATATTPPDAEAWLTVRPVDRPDDLTALGITVSEYLSAWADAEAALLLFDSITESLRSVDLQRLFRFLHVMTTRAGTSGVGSYYRLDPDAHDEQILTTLASLFDTVLEYEGGGEWVRPGK